jgi:hypothetical protein
MARMSRTAFLSSELSPGSWGFRIFRLSIENPFCLKNCVQKINEQIRVSYKESFDSSH